MRVLTLGEALDGIDIKYIYAIGNKIVLMSEKEINNLSYTNKMRLKVNEVLK